MYFIDAILPIPLKQTFTYSVNKDEAAFLRPGMRVAVPFGKSKVYTGIVFRIHQKAPAGYETKAIDHILDETAIITPQQLQHWQWLAHYYMCSLGEVVKAALPSAFLLESETIIKLSGEKDTEDQNLSDEEFLVIEALQHQSSLHINDVRAILDKKRVLPIIQKLIAKGMVKVEETVFEKYVPKSKRYIKLKTKYREEEALRGLLDSLSDRATKQREVLMTLFMMEASSKKPISSTALQNRSQASAGVIKALLDKGILEEYYIRQDRLDFSGNASEESKKLNDAQTTALEQIVSSFSTQDIVLLHGVTSSGKTEIYVRLIEKMLASGKQVLYMLPEIALTTQLINRLQKYFGDSIAVYHSRFSVHERVEVWNNVLSQKPKAQLVVGARSSLFLPFQNLGFVIIDEEHEPSFKQYNPAPRYHARDAATVLAGLHEAKVLMGSATPSLETYHNAQSGKFGLVTLKKRYGNVLMPEIELIDLREKGKKKQMTGHFSDRLLEEIRNALNSGEQVILFQNRRGYSPVVECTTCGVSPQCPNCDVSLTFHRHKNQLRCHYCGYHIAMMESCMACGSQTLDTKGFGTEQIETELKSLFPDHRIARMDQDTTKGKHAHAKLIDALENEEIDILVGTQMLAKGLDFRNISLVGVMHADNLLNYPDFRAHERSFQLLHQVAGRAGRTQKRGKVLIQAFNPYHQILKQVSVNDYEAMYHEQLQERQNYKYPPFYRTIKITFKDKNLTCVQKASFWFGQALERQFKENILGPEPPPIGRIKNKYISNLLVKIPRAQSLPKTKQYIANVERGFNAIKEFSSVRITVDVDNY